MPSVCAPSIFGASITSTAPRTPAPVNAILPQSFPGSLNGSAWEVSSPMTTNRLPLPSAETAAMLPCKPGGMSGPTAAFAQFGGSKVSPSGSLREAKNWGSMPLGATSTTLNSGPKLGLTSTILPMSAFAPEEFASDEQPTSQHTDASASSTTLNIVVNLPNADA